MTGFTVTQIKKICKDAPNVDTARKELGCTWEELHRFMCLYGVEIREGFGPGRPTREIEEGVLRELYPKMSIKELMRELGTSFQVLDRELVRHGIVRRGIGEKK